MSHEPALRARGISAGKPLTDTRNFVDELRNVPRAGELPPIVLATLRKKMIALSEEIGDGMVFANGARSHMGQSLSVISGGAKKRDDFFIGDMIPTCVSDDIEAAKAVNRKTLTGLCNAAELSQLLEGGRLCRGNGRYREGARAGRP
ncbi:MAG: LLM class flavin-dependent oxidoreductase [Gammaproteobacteria bacterium]|nr:LLM class flavin-dependent oxidoreductase [Gammaproteobacteria bacterium]